MGSSGKSPPKTDHDVYAAMREFNANFIDLVDEVYKAPETTEAHKLHTHVRAFLPFIQVELSRVQPAFMRMAKLDEEQRAMLGDANGWKVYWIKMMGHTFRGRPNWLTDAGRHHPEVLNLMLSWLPPGVELPPHKGPFKGVVRYHMGLRCPKGDVGIEVHGQEYKWQEGKGVVFDDTLWHKAWNRTTEDRVVLFADVLRQLPPHLERQRDALVLRLERTSVYKRMAAKARKST